MKNFNVKRLAALLVLTRVVFFVSAAVTEYPAEMMNSIRSNRYFSESLRLQKLAHQLFARGDYDQAAKCASDAAKTAAVSDLYVKQQVKIYIANNKISDALQRLSWADMSNINQHFPAEFYNAKTYYNLGLIARDARKWDDAISNADKVIETLAAVNVPIKNADPVAPEKSESTAPKTGLAENNKTIPGDADDKGILPARYKVRSWDKYGDCLWNIAGRSWAYGDPYRWPILYKANKDKIPDPKNPDLIEEGTVIEIPSINGEKRLGDWDSGKAYNPLKK